MGTAAATPKDRLMLLHGADDFRRHEVIRSLIKELGEEAGFNLSMLEGERLAVEQFQTAAMTPPFLGSRRLVVIEGLLGRFQRGERGRRESTDVGAWSGLPALLQALPDTTHIIFDEAALNAGNPLLRLVRPLVTIREFGRMRGPELSRWIDDRARELGGAIQDRAVQALITIAGEDLWTLHNELEKLILFADGLPVTEEMVRTLASGAREASVFDLVNMMVAHRRADSLQLLNQLLAQGVAPALLLFMIARQVRQMLRAVDLLGMSPEEARVSLGVNQTWQAEQALRQARAIGRDGLLAAHSRLVEADYGTKSGRFSAEMALELLVVELSSSQITPAPPFKVHRPR